MLKNFFLLAAAAAALATSSFAQGPLILMGIDAEDGGPGGHGPISAYTSVVTDGIAPNVTNGGAGILVIGGGKSPFDNVTTFWDALSAGAGLPVSYVNGANIASQSFAGFGIIGVASSFSDTPSGGLSAAEGAALNARSDDIRDHVNGGGGLLGFSQGGIAVPYGYMGALGSFTVNTSGSYSSVTPTPAGELIGITDTNLDVCCWHDQYLAFPAFLQVLAINDVSGEAAAIGGFEVVIIEGIALTPPATILPINTSHTLTASVADSLGDPLIGIDVAFEILSGPNAGQTAMGVTDMAGQTTFSYASAAVGIDMVEACFFDSTATEVCSNIASVEWIPGLCFVIDFETDDDLVTPLENGQHINPGDEFGGLCIVDGLSSTGEGATIFDSDPLGPNSGAMDQDLLVDRGNVLIAQEDATQTVMGYYDSPNDDFGGGNLVFQFLQDTQVCSVDLVDIDLGLGQDALVSLFDTNGLVRRYVVEEGFTEDVALDGGAGYRTLNLQTLMPQMGYLGMAIASEDMGFDANTVRTMVIDFGSSAGADNVSFIAAAAVAVPGPTINPVASWMRRP